MEHILDRCEKFEDMHVWPQYPRINARMWLENFTEDELPHAHALLSSFLFYNEQMCAQLLKSSFYNIVSYFNKQETRNKEEAWHHFLNTTIFTYPADENPSKSGSTLARFTRQELKLSENRIYSPANALEALYDGKTNYAVMVDDFIGSGDQFSDTWREEYCRGRNTISYQKITSERKEVVIFYIPFIATNYGLVQISQVCKNYQIIPGQILSDNYCAFSENSFVWPKELKSTALEFIEQTSLRAGIQQVRGHHELGFTVAVHKSMPDVTLPLLRHKSRNWAPLMERI